MHKFIARWETGHGNWVELVQIEEAGTYYSCHGRHAGMSLGSFETEDLAVGYVKALIDRGFFDAPDPVWKRVFNG